MYYPHVPTVRPIPVKVPLHPYPPPYPYMPPVYHPAPYPMMPSDTHTHYTPEGRPWMHVGTHGVKQEPKENTITIPEGAYHALVAAAATGSAPSTKVTLDQAEYQRLLQQAQQQPAKMITTPEQYTPSTKVTLDQAEYQRLLQQPAKVEHYAPSSPRYVYTRQ